MDVAGGPNDLGALPINYEDFEVNDNAQVVYKLSNGVDCCQFPRNHIVPYTQTVVPVKVNIETVVKKVNSEFEECDTDRDGFITYDEYKSKYGDELATGFMQVMDSNSDAKVSKDEFFSLMVRNSIQRAVATEQRKQKRFRPTL